MISVDVARHMKRITTLVCFASAHLTAEEQLVKYFGANGKIDDDDEAEMARCILQSQLSVYKALMLGVSEGRQMNQDLLKELKWVYQRKAVTEHLESFVLSANS